MQRRNFLRSSLLAPIAPTGLSLLSHGCASAPVAQGENPFQHGVASGDPLSQHVILWTRVSPVDPTDSTPRLVRWWVSLNADGSDRIIDGEVSARIEHDFTVKIDAGALAPDTRYHYGFECEGHSSPTGRTRTLPVGEVAKARFAVTSCANYPQGYFNAYGHIATVDDLNAVLSLGDYLYEYGEGEYGNGAALGRIPQPPHEIVSLADYRERHAQHKADPDLIAAHAAHPWIVIWDDHESANNSWSGGAENHTSTPKPESNAASEGRWEPRKAAAIKAYYEWMPIRELPSGLFRHFRIGQLADLVMLDTRLAGRDEQVAAGDLAAARDPNRSLLGPIQEQQFLDHLSATKRDNVRWKIVGQQVVFAPWAEEDTLLNPDSWDGYRESRQRVLTHLQEQSIQDVVILTGDVHSAWGMEVPSRAQPLASVSKDDTESHAIELVTPAVSSPPLASASARTQALVENASSQLHHIKYADGMNNGYMTVEFTPERATAEWFYTGAPTQRQNTAQLAKTLSSPAGSNRLVEPVEVDTDT